MLPPRRTIVYVDGFNLYYGAVKGTPYRWLDLGALCNRLIPNDDVVGIKYFTAHVKDHPGKAGTSRRQLTYLRALRTVPHLTVHLGHFLTRPVTRALVKPPKRGPKFREVWQTEEKGSDVNLASHLLIDGFRARYDLAVVISNDGDLKEPVRFVREELDAPVGVFNPHKARSWALSPRVLPMGSYYRPIKASHVRQCQFPDVLADAKGEIRKPSRWNGP